MEVKKRRIKVLFTIPNFDTAGSGKALLNIASRLNHELFEPMIACESDKGFFFKVVMESGIPVHIMKLTTSMSNRWSGLQHVLRIAAAFRRIKPHLVHSFHYSADYSEAMAARLAGCKWVYTKKNMNWGGSSANGWKLRSWLANGIVAQNTDMFQFFGKSKKVSLIPRGVNVNEFAGKESDKNKIRVEFGILGNAKIILTVANLVPVKGIEVLMQAFNTLHPQLPEVHLVIVGDDTSDYARSLKQLAAGSDARNQIHFTGKRSDVRDFLAAANVFVLPTLNQGRQEGSPVSLLEAMAAGKCVLASDVAGVRDQLQDFKTHLFVPGDDAMLSAKLMEYLALTDAELEQLGYRFRNHVTNNYTIEKEVKVHEQFYLDMCD
ncbi:MAG: glycosyltransferase [Cyclobacteriaceae bacterium]|nr:glycosyltransferase [Cyclobacteriaceae bacterium]